MAIDIMAALAVAVMEWTMTIDIIVASVVAVLFIIGVVAACTDRSGVDASKDGKKGPDAHE